MLTLEKNGNFVKSLKVFTKMCEKDCRYKSIERKLIQ
ncbi:MAG: hypothetical protein DRP62_02620 [Planctomycetota bacterium]|nr:MAG: hypothetical protein DRP62_02620 [Planctomycetota bacterium]